MKMLEEINLSLLPGYRLDTPTQDAHLLHRADGSSVRAFLPELASKKIVRRVAARDNLLATDRGDLARPRWFSGTNSGVQRALENTNDGDEVVKRGPAYLRTFKEHRLAQRLG